MSSFLLDTHTFIWLSEDDASLPKNLRVIIEEADNVYLSIVSLWEIAIKLRGCLKSIVYVMLHCASLHSASQVYTASRDSSLHFIPLRMTNYTYVGLLKHPLSIGKPSLQKSFETIGSEIQFSDITLLPISFFDTVQIRKLPLHHRDPFDRMLVAQAINHSLTIISQDTQLDAYSIQRLWR